MLLIDKRLRGLQVHRVREWDSGIVVARHAMPLHAHHAADVISVFAVFKSAASESGTVASSSPA
eukprot:CAMPEP_0171623334 /NCGR_PEP_ID=MMETSP0990-20121206/17877_1 /TAXON_ID=483369 /ORGANISM="non described non described, Strain CCMP2098" /LENGTH=63 /DNA_ID=CAMNT_0012189503 /DNA_START=149 /DNA_END=337 /DNA_ORIENTATION=+